MLVLSREPGTSIHISGFDETCVVTFLQAISQRSAISALVNHTSAARAGRMESRSAELILNQPYRISKSIDITLIDLRQEKARIAINTPRDYSVHRLEIYEALRREDPGDPEDGPAGSPVPRPTSPKPPSLDVRLDEPPSTEDHIE